MSLNCPKTVNYKVYILLNFHHTRGNQTLTRHLEVVWFDATDVRWLLAQQYLHQIVQAVFELCYRSFWSLLTVQISDVEDGLKAKADRSLQHLKWKHFSIDLKYLCYGVGRVRHNFAKVSEQQVVILLQEAVHVVGHFSRVVDQSEFLQIVNEMKINNESPLPRCNNNKTHIASHYLLGLNIRLHVAYEVIVIVQVNVELLEEAQIRRFSGSEALLVQQGNNTC